MRKNSYYKDPRKSSSIVDQAYAHLASAVIRRSIIDGLKYAKLKKKRKSFSNCHEKMSYLKDGWGFIITNRLERFIESTGIGLEAYSIRKKFKTLVVSGKELEEE